MPVESRCVAEEGGEGVFPTVKPDLTPRTWSKKLVSYLMNGQAKNISPTLIISCYSHLCAAFVGMRLKMTILSAFECSNSIGYGIV